MLKKILVAFGIILVLLLGAAIAIPYFFKDEIIAAVKQAANDELTAKVDFSDVDISLFREFPKLAVGLSNISVVNGPGPFEGVNLVKAKRIDVAVDLWAAVFNNDINIKGLTLDEPEIKVYVLSNGDANYDITKPAPETAPVATSSESSPINLERYEIKNGSLLYDDRGLDMVAEIKGMNHTGKGNLGADVYDLTMQTDIKGLSVNYGGVQYLRNAHTEWNTVLNADMKNMKFTMSDNVAKVNDLKLMLNGFVQMPNETDILMDLKFGTPQNDFKSLLSIIPGAYTQDFADVKADGTVSFGGIVQGKYNEKTYPAFKIDMKVGNASVKYPTLPLGISGINVDASVNSPSSILNAMTVDISRFALVIGSNPLEGYFKLKTPISDPTVDTRLKGTLNLAELTKAFPVEGVDELAGIINADVTTKAAMSQIDAGKYDEVNMAGTLGLTGFTYRAAGAPVTKIQSLNTTFSPQKVDIQNFNAKIGKSDINASGSIDNVLAYFSDIKTMKGSIKFNSAYMDANELMGEDAASDEVVPNDVPAADEKVFDRWDFDVDGKIAKMDYDVYKLSDMAMTGHFTPNKMNINNFGLKIGASDLSGNGQILNAWNYLFDNQTVEGVINLNSSNFDLNQFMTEEAVPAGGTAAPAEEGVIPVPEKMNMTINADFASVKYTNMDLKNMTGAVVVKNDAATLKDCTATVLGGLIALNGEYNTQNLAKPSFNMDMALQNFGFKEAFATFTTVKAFAPVAQLMDGKFNTSLSLTGLLGKDMMPDLATLSAAGFLETIAAVFNNFKPMNMIGEKLNVDYLKKLQLANTKNWFEIKDGKVTVKPFDTKVGDVAMRIGGSHGITNDMDYQIVTKVPRAALGTAANGGINFLSKEASKYGVSIAQGEYINTQFSIAGTLFSPKVTMKVLGSDGQATMQDEVKNTVTDYTNKAKDSVTNVANRELENAKAKANAAADKLKDTVGKVVDQKVNEATQKAAEAAKNEVGKVLGDQAGQKAGEVIGGSAGQKAGEVINGNSGKTIEKAQDKLNKWDPFKKKKGGK